jgi:hypothetical protein
VECVCTLQDDGSVFGIIQVMAGDTELMYEAKGYKTKPLFWQSLYVRFLSKDRFILMDVDTNEEDNGVFFVFKDKGRE